MCCHHNLVEYFFYWPIVLLIKFYLSAFLNVYIFILFMFFFLKFIINICMMTPLEITTFVCFNVYRPKSLVYAQFVDIDQLEISGDLV